MGPKDNVLEIFKKNPRSFRRHIAMDGLFALLPIPSGDDFRNDDETFIRILFRRVLDRALLDIIGFPPKVHKKTGKQKLNKYEREALEWASDRDEESDFNYVCELSGLPPEMVRRCLFKLKDIKDSLSKQGKVNPYKRKVK